MVLLITILYFQGIAPGMVSLYTMFCLIGLFEDVRSSYDVIEEYDRAEATTTYSKRHISRTTPSKPLPSTLKESLH